MTQGELYQGPQDEHHCVLSGNSDTNVQDFLAHIRNCPRVLPGVHEWAQRMCQKQIRLANVIDAIDRVGLLATSSLGSGVRAGHEECRASSVQAAA